VIHIFTDPRRPTFIISPQPVDAGGFADKAKIGQGAACPHMIDQRAGAVDGGAFLVAGDDQADDTGIVGNIAQRGDKGGDAALHVDCTAAVEQIAFHYRFERFARPAFTGRHNVQMPGKGEMAAAFSTDRKQVFHRPAMRRIGIVCARDEPFDGEAQWQQHRLHRVKHAAACGRDAFAGDQAPGIGESEIFSHLSSHSRESGNPSPALAYCPNGVR
jgi:hypothetical protein